MKYLLFLSLFVLAASCADDPAAGEAAAGDDPTATTVTTTDEERLAQIAPPPPMCQMIPETEVLAILGEETRIPMPGSRSTTGYNTCRYDIDGPGWMANLVLEFGDDNRGIQTIRDEVAGAQGADAITIEGARGRMMNDGRVAVIDAGQPFRIKFSARPRAGRANPFDGDEQQRVIRELAAVIVRAQR